VGPRPTGDHVEMQRAEVNLKSQKKKKKGPPQKKGGSKKKKRSRERDLKRPPLKQTGEHWEKIQERLTKKNQGDLEKGSRCGQKASYYQQGVTKPFSRGGVQRNVPSPRSRRGEKRKNPKEMKKKKNTKN